MTETTLNKIKRRTLLGVGGLSVAAIGLAASPAIFPDAINTFSEGWRLGELNKFSLRGLVVRTGEGDLMLGRDSSRREITNESGEKTVINPWSFSTNSDVYASYQNRASSLRGQLVAVRYRQLYFRPAAFTYETDYVAEEILPVEPSLADTPYAVPSFRPNERSGRSDGDRIGRIVKVTTKGRVFKTYEATIQVGNAGNEFIDVSILDEGMYQAAIRFLRSGRRVGMFYSVTLTRNPLARDTRYELRMIESIPERS